MVVQKNQLYLYVLVILRNYPFRKIQILKYKFNKNILFLHTENYKILMNKIKEELDS